jgi:Tol biopolymer transport system component
VISSRDGSGARQLTLGEEPAWSPNGDRIAFSKSAVPGPWVVNTDGSGERKIVDGSVSTPDRTGASLRRLELFDPSTGRRLGTASFPKNANGFSASHRTIVFAVGRRIWALDTRTRKQRLLATAVADPVGVSIEGRRVAWAENLKTTARIRALTVPR